MKTMYRIFPVDIAGNAATAAVTEKSGAEAERKKTDEKINARALAQKGTRKVYIYSGACELVFGDAEERKNEGNRCAFGDDGEIRQRFSCGRVISPEVSFTEGLGNAEK